MKNKEFIYSQDEIVQTMLVSVLADIFRANLTDIADDNKIFNHSLKNSTTKLYNQLDRAIMTVYADSVSLDEFNEIKKLLTEEFQGVINDMKTQILNTIKIEDK